MSTPTSYLFFGTPISEHQFNTEISSDVIERIRQHMTEKGIIATRSNYKQYQDGCLKYRLNLSKTEILSETKVSPMKAILETEIKIGVATNRTFSYSCTQSEVAQLFVPHNQYINLQVIECVSYQLDSSGLTLNLSCVHENEDTKIWSVYLVSKNRQINTEFIQEICKLI